MAAYDKDSDDEAEDSGDDWDVRSPTAGDVGAAPDGVDRRCTDVFCLVLFSLCLAALGYVSYFSQRHGDLNRFRAFEDSNHHLCGFSHENWDKPYLLFCLDSIGAQLDMHRAFCVDKCPLGNEAQTVCGDGPLYASENFMDMMCRPVSNTSLVSKEARHFVERATQSVVARIVLDRWPMLMTSALISVMTSYVFIWGLLYCANSVVKIGLLLLTVLPLASGAWAVGMLGQVGFFPDPPVHQMYFPVGICLLLVGFAFGCIQCMMRHQIDTAIDCLEMASVCVMQTPILLWHPLIFAIVYFVVSALFVVGLLDLLTVTSTRGMFHSIQDVWQKLSPEQEVYVPFFIGMYLWLQQCIFALAEFVGAYAAILWCCHGGLRGEGSVPLYSDVGAYWAGIRYHAGTVAFGAAVIAITRPFRLVFGFLISCMDMGMNPLCWVTQAVCRRCITCYQAIIDPFGKQAYIDVAINGHSFCEAARRSNKVVVRQIDTVRILNGATWLFQTALMGTDVFMAAYLIWMYSKDVLKDHELVALALGTAAGVISLVVAIPFAMVFDTVSDTILYCSEVEKERALRLSKGESGNFSRYCPCAGRGGMPAVSDFTSLFSTEEARGPLLEDKKDTAMSRSGPRQDGSAGMQGWSPANSGAEAGSPTYPTYYGAEVQSSSPTYGQPRGNKGYGKGWYNVS